MARGVLAAAAALSLNAGSAHAIAPTPVMLLSPLEPPATPIVTVFSVPAGRFIISRGQWTAADGPNTRELPGAGGAGEDSRTIQLPTNLASKRGAAGRGRGAPRGKYGGGNTLPTIIGADGSVLSAAPGE